MRGRRFVIALVSAASVAAGSGGQAQADGLPVLGVDVGGTGVVDGSGARYVTIPAGRDTVVARVDTADGRILGSRLLRGTLTVPAVAYDGSAAGLSGDGGTLVLIEPRAAFPRARTTLAVLETRGLRRQATIRLRGDFSYDAVSPRGSLLYLIQYTSPKDPTRYAVRAFDLRAGRLLRAPVVDPYEPDEAMRGAPLTRVTSRTGRWAYTLYDGAGGTPFLHALDTSNRTARCIDLDGLAGTQLARLRLELAPGGRTLRVNDISRPLALVDTRTFRISAPAGPRPAARTEAGSAGTGLFVPVAGLVAAVAFLGLGSIAVRRRRRLVLAE